MTTLELSRKGPDVRPVAMPLSMVMLPSRMGRTFRAPLKKAEACRRRRRRACNCSNASSGAATTTPRPHASGAALHDGSAHAPRRARDDVCGGAKVGSREPVTAGGLLHHDLLADHGALVCVAVEHVSAVYDIPYGLDADVTRVSHRVENAQRKKRRIVRHFAELGGTYEARAA